MAGRKSCGNDINTAMLVEKLQYIHYNPVRRGYVEDPVFWRYSSAGNYAGKPSPHKTAHTCDLTGETVLKGNRAVYTGPDCHLTMTFTADGLSVVQEMEKGGCDFGLNVTSSGTTIKQMRRYGNGLYGKVSSVGWSER